MQVLELIATGQTTKAGALKLKVSAKTIEFHRTKLMKRLKIWDIANLTRFAIRAGLILPCLCVLLALTPRPPGAVPTKPVLRSPQDISRLSAPMAIVLPPKYQTVTLAWEVEETAMACFLSVGIEASTNLSQWAIVWSGDYPLSPTVEAATSLARVEMRVTLTDRPWAREFYRVYWSWK
jgi:DNA-binding CsgD family transcriptional regulator